MPHSPRVVAAHPVRLPIQRAFAESYSEHDPVLLEILRAPLNLDVISICAAQLDAVVPCQTDGTGLPTPPVTPVKVSFDRSSAGVPGLEAFIASVFDRSRVQLPTVLVMLVYLERMRAKMPRMARGLPCTLHRIFLATLVVAAKVRRHRSGSSLTASVHARLVAGQQALVALRLWPLLDGRDHADGDATCVALSALPLTLVVLTLIDYDLGVTEADLLREAEPLIAMRKERFRPSAARAPSLDACSSSSSSMSSSSSSAPSSPPSTPVSTASMRAIRRVASIASVHVRAASDMIVSLSFGGTAMGETQPQKV